MLVYKVRGRWPFPLDMLRHDDSKAATPADQALIDRLSGEFCPEDLRRKVEVALTIDARWRSPMRPNEERWQSFGWQVLDEAA